jgi:transcriptional regulator CtsR
VSRQFLEDIYDRILKEKFKTENDYIEEIYSKINHNISSDFLKLTKELKLGSEFIKYGRHGNSNN